MQAPYILEVLWRLVRMSFDWIAARYYTIAYTMLVVIMVGFAVYVVSRVQIKIVTTEHNQVQLRAE